MPVPEVSVIPVVQALFVVNWRKGYVGCFWIFLDYFSFCITRTKTNGKSKKLEFERCKQYVKR